MATTPRIGDSPIYPIGQPSISGQSYVNTGNNFDCAIGGMPFFFGASRDYPIKRETAPYRKQQTDIQREPGEQSITGWWLRSQSSFHYGAGVRYQEPIMGENVQYRFHKSAGVEVFNVGRVTLLPDVSLLLAVTGSPLIVSAKNGSTDVVFFTDGANLWYSDGTTNTAVTWGGTGNILDICQDGQYYYAASTSAIYRGTLAGGAGSAVMTYANPATTVKLGFAKQRVIAGINNSIYEVVPISSFTVTATRLDSNIATIKTSVAHNFTIGSQITIAGIADTTYNGTWTVSAIASTTEASFLNEHASINQVVGLAGTVILASNINLPIYTHPSSTWIWTGMADGPNAIYVSGYAGVTSSIFRLALDVSGAVPLLNRALTAAELPPGEYVTCLGSYLGKFLIIGTNKGVRVGQIDTSGWLSSGYITYGPLTFITNGFDPATATHLYGSAVTAVAFKDRFAYVTVTNYIDNGDGTLSSGLIKIDLSREIIPGQNQYAYATNLKTASTASCSSVASLGASNTLLFGIAGVGVYQQSATLVTYGYIQIGQVRYFTLEDKHFELLKLRMAPNMLGALETNVIKQDQTSVRLIKTDNSFDYTQDITALDTLDTSPTSSIALKFGLYSSVAQQVNSEDVFLGYQIKAIPAVRRQRFISMPLMNFDFVEDRYNNKVGYDGMASANVFALENIESDGDVIVIQDFTTGETIRGIIESQLFTRITPPNRRFNGEGGILYVQIRAVS